MDQLTLSEQHRGVNLLSTIEELLILDEIWTQHIESGAENDIDTLDKMATRIIMLLELVPAEASWVLTLVDRDVVNAKSALNTFGRNVDIPQGGSNTHAPDFADRVIELISRAGTELPAKVAIERNDISRKMTCRKAGNATDGDMSHETHCFLQGLACGVTAGAALATSSLAEGIFAGYQAVELAHNCF
jgi:hypothetical protein